MGNVVLTFCWTSIETDSTLKITETDSMARKFIVNEGLKRGFKEENINYCSISNHKPNMFMFCMSVSGTNLLFKNSKTVESDMHAFGAYIKQKYHSILPDLEYSVEILPM